MKCLLCLQQSVQDEMNCIQVNSLQWLELNIKQLIDKYLWCIFQAQITSEDFVCSPCWEELNDFHKFYTCIENVHNGTEFKVKTEIDTLEEEINMSEKNPVKLEESLEMSHTRIENSHNATEFKVKTEIYTLEEDSNTYYHMTHVNPMKLEQGSNMFVIIKQENGKDMENGTDLEISVDDSYCENIDGTSNSSTDGNESEMSENDKFLKEHFQIICNKCQLPFNRFSLLCQHYRIEHYEQGFVACCQTKFFSLHLLVDHINWHLNPEYFKCSYCDKLFTTRGYLRTHTKIHERHKLKHLLPSEKKSPCNKLAHDRQTLKNLPPSEKKLPCNECGKLYDNEYILTQHQRTVHQTMTICDICGLTFSGTTLLTLHRKKHAITVRRVKCDVCGLLLPSKSMLRRHKDQEHSVGGKREYECPICMKISPSPRALKDHIQKTHEMSFQCTVCKKEFQRLDHFQSHIARHTGTPLYHCPLCPKQCNSIAYMNKHRKLMHAIEWEEAQRKKNSGNLSSTK